MRSSELPLHGRKNDRLIDVLARVGADHYISGPSARAYIAPERFDEAGIALEYAAYDYPEYAQPHPPYEAGGLDRRHAVRAGPGERSATFARAAARRC